MKKNVTSGTSQLTRARARQCALLCTLRTLRRSVLNGRPMSLPNLLRYYRRRGSEMMPMLISGPPDEQWLVYFYMREQPFKQTDWRRWCRAVKASKPRSCRISAQ